MNFSKDHPAFGPLARTRAVLRDLGLADRQIEAYCRSFAVDRPPLRRPTGAKGPAPGPAPAGAKRVGERRAKGTARRTGG